MLLLCMIIGVIGGLRAMTAPAAISWAAATGHLDLSGTWLAFFGFQYAPWIFTFLAIAELITDQLPTTPSRKVPVQFATRLLVGALCGAAIGSGSSMLLAGAGVGLLGAVIGTFGGAAVRGRLAASFGKDLPAALIEDVAALAGAAFVVNAL
jgi:hypothetical protein